MDQVSEGRRTVLRPRQASLVADQSNGQPLCKTPALQARDVVAMDASAVGLTDMGSILPPHEIPSTLVTPVMKSAGQ